MVRTQILAQTAILAALALGACDRRPEQVAVQAEPPVAGVPAYLERGAAPVVGAPMQIVRGAPARANYRYIDRAYAMTAAFDEAPPDYAFDYDGIEPWAWRGGDGGYWVVEPLDVGERYYYYEPGAYRPFLVRDPDYAYAYDNGVLVEIYDAYGRPRRSGYTPYLADRARRYADRGQQLYYAAQRGPRRNDYAPRWQARRNAIVAQQRAWGQARDRDAGWRAWRDSPPAVTYQTAWAQERVRRQPNAWAPQGGPGRGGDRFDARRGRQDDRQAPVFARAQPEVRSERDQRRPFALAGQQVFDARGGFQRPPGGDGRAAEQQVRRQQREAERQAQAFNQHGRGGRHDLERQGQVQQQARAFEQQQRRGRDEGERQAQIQQRAQFQLQARQQREAEQQARFAERQARQQQHDFARQGQAQAQQQAQFADRLARQQQREAARQAQMQQQQAQQAQRLARNEAQGPRQGGLPGAAPRAQGGGGDQGGGKHGGGRGHGRDKG